MIAAHTQMEKDNGRNVHKLEVMAAPVFPLVWVVFCAAATIHHAADWKQKCVANGCLKNVDEIGDRDLSPLETFM